MILDKKFINRISELLDTNGWELDKISVYNELYMEKDCVQINNPELGVSLEKSCCDTETLELCADDHLPIMITLKPSLFGIKKNPLMSKYDKLVAELWEQWEQNIIDKMNQHLESILNSSGV